MNQNWPTKYQDMVIAREIIAEYGGDEGLLGIFEMETDFQGQVQNVKLSEWILKLMGYFRSLYGDEQGDLIVKRVISSCMINGQTIH